VLPYVNGNYQRFAPTCYLNQVLYLRVRPEPIQVEHRKCSHYAQIIDKAEARIDKSTGSERCLTWTDAGKPEGLFTTSFLQPDLIIANKAGVYPSALGMGVS
jgi:hypothetical protein